MEPTQVPPSDLENKKKQAETDKAVWDAVAAAAKARLAAVKAQIGEVPSSGYTGDVTLKDKAGTTEAALLAAKAIETAAQRIVEALPQQTMEQQTMKKRVLLYAAAEIPNFQALMTFRATLAWVNKAFDDAQSKDTTEIDTQLAEATGLAAAGLALDAVNKLVGFFRTDYTVGGIGFTLEDSLLVHALAGLIAASNKNLDVQLPAVYSPEAVSNPLSGILGELISLSQRKMKAQAKVNFYNMVFGKPSAPDTKGSGEEEEADRAKTDKDPADPWKAAIGLYDSSFSHLMTANDKGIVPLTTIIRESVVYDALSKGNLLLLVKLHQSGGAYYTKKNIRTFLGRMPFFHMGGVVASFVLLDGKTGGVLKSGVVPVHGGFFQADELREKVNGD